MVRANVGLCVIAEWIVPTVNSAPLANGTEQMLQGAAVGGGVDQASQHLSVPLQICWPGVRRVERPV